jgi:hypothetical protein
LQIRMMQQECIYARFHLRKVFFVCRTFVTTRRTARVVTVTGTGRPSPEKSVFRKHLPHIGGAHYLAVQGQDLGITFIRYGESECVEVEYRIGRNKWKIRK